MKQIEYEDALKMVTKYVEHLADEKRIDPKKDKFTILLPLENDQAMILRLVNEDGKRTMEIDITDCAFIMPKQINTVFDIFEQEN